MLSTVTFGWQKKIFFSVSVFLDRNKYMKLFACVSLALVKEPGKQKMYEQQLFHCFHGFLLFCRSKSCLK